MLTLVLCGVWTSTVVADDAGFTAQGNRLADELRRSGGVKSERILQTIRETPRHRFIPAGVRQQAYFDMALPIGHQQTISSPRIVAQMTEQLDPQPTDRILEIGTGSGYQAAILSPLVREVYSIEIVEPLGRRAMHTLRTLKYENVFVRIGDGYQGWPEHAPFDKIIVTCSPHDVPQPLVDQLREGGRIIVPVGERYQQVLYRLEKKNGQLLRIALLPTLFVPMTGTAETERSDDGDPKQLRLVNGDFEQEQLVPSAAGAGRLAVKTETEKTETEKTETEKSATKKSATEKTESEKSESEKSERGGEGGAFLADHQLAVPGWYYEQQVTVVRGPDSAQGQGFARFKNRDVGRSAHLLQGLAMRGDHIERVRLSARVRAHEVQSGPAPDMQPSVVVSFYDRDRRELGHRWLGPWRGTLPWTHVEGVFPVPAGCREAIVRIGLFGATGQFDIDEITVAPDR